MEEKVVLGGAGGQGALEVAGGRVEGEQGGLAGVGWRRGLALSQQVVAGTAELCRGGPWRMVHGGEGPQGICGRKKPTPVSSWVQQPCSLCSWDFPYLNAPAFMYHLCTVMEDGVACLWL